MISKTVPRLNILMITHQRRHKAHARSHAMANHLVERGHRVSLMVIADERMYGIFESEWDGVHVIETPDLLWGQLRSGWDPWDLINRVVFLKHDKQYFDIVHCFETRPATIYPALFYCRKHHLPFVTDWNDWWGRGGIIDELRPKWYSMLFGCIETYYEEAFRKKGAGITVISSALAKRAQALGIPAGQICHLPGGALPELFQAREIEVCRKRASLPLSIPILGFSSLDSHLNLDIVMKALSIVVKRYPLTKLLITGKTNKSVIDLASSLGVADNIYLTGFLPYHELPWYLGCADLFLLPFPDKTYNIGRWPNKICEYMSLGRPTVSNPVGDIKPLFENHKIGLLSAWDSQDFADKIIYLIENPNTAMTLGENARNLATTVYAWDVLIPKLEDFYEMVLNDGYKEDFFKQSN